MEKSREKILQIPIERLVVDDENIRVDPDVGEELINSVKNKGVLEPLIVRPIKELEDEEKYGIVSGSRRFSAAINANLNTVPCIVKDLSDNEARAISITENKHRKDIPNWRWIEVINDLYNRINTGMTKMEKIEKVMELTDFGKSTIHKYLDLGNLPDLVKARLKNPSERVEKEKKQLEETSSQKSDKLEKIPIMVAEKLARNEFFVDKSSQDEEWAQQAINVIKDKYDSAPNRSVGLKTVDNALEVMKLHPTIPPEEAARKTYTLETEWKPEVDFEPKYREAVNRYASDAGYGSNESAIKEIVRNYLEEKGYL